MSIFDEIANPKMATPITAFLVGREQKRQRERQEQQDILDEEFKRTQLDLSARRIAAYEDQIELAGRPKPPTLTTEQKHFVQARADGYAGTFPEFLKEFSKKSGVTVNVNPDGLETPGNRDKIQLNRAATIDRMGEMAQSILNVREKPRTTGMIGAGSSAANALGDVPVIGDWITAATTGLTDATPEELSAIRTQGQTMIGRLVPVITQDTSGRYTDTEQKRTEDIQAQSKFWRTSAQVIGGLSELQAIDIRGELRDSMLIPGLDPADTLQLMAGQPIDLANDDDLEAWHSILVGRYGLSPQKAEDEIKLHLDILGL